MENFNIGSNSDNNSNSIIDFVNAIRILDNHWIAENFELGSIYKQKANQYVVDLLLFYKEALSCFTVAYFLNIIKQALDQDVSNTTYTPNQDTYISENDKMTLELSLRFTTLHDVLLKYNTKIAELEKSGNTFNVYQARKFYQFIKNLRTDLAAVYRVHNNKQSSKNLRIEDINISKLLSNDIVQLILNCLTNMRSLTGLSDMAIEYRFNDLYSLFEEHVQNVAELNSNIEGLKKEIAILKDTCEKNRIQNINSNKNLYGLVV
jgi:hypothetical protein